MFIVSEKSVITPIMNNFIKTFLNYSMKKYNQGRNIAGFLGVFWAPEFAELDPQCL